MQVGDLMSALEAFDSDQEVKIIVNGDDDVYYIITTIESDGAGGVEIGAL